MADRIAIVDRGRIVAAGTPAELTAGPQPRLRFRLDRALDAADLAALRAASRRPGGGPSGRSTAQAATASTALESVLSRGREVAPRWRAGRWCAERGLLIAELRTTGATLEERYLALTGERADDG